MCPALDHIGLQTENSYALGFQSLGDVFINEETLPALTQRNYRGGGDGVGELDLPDIKFCTTVMDVQWNCGELRPKRL